MKPKAVALPGLDIELRPYKALGFHPACVIVGISSEGIVGPLVASQLIERLKMDQVCALESPMFPPTAVIYFQKPKFPARIYGSARHRVAVVLAEFAPPDELARPLALAILTWCESQGAGRIIGIESFPAEDANPVSLGVAAIGSTPSDRKAIHKARLAQVQHGSVTGVAGVLLNEGAWRGRGVIALMASLGGGVADGVAAVRVLASIHRLQPKFGLAGASASPTPTELERAIRAARERTTTHDFI
ncbi:MAG: proteasome assembly chaperone family protein [Thermoplasmatota archaeon]